MSANSKSPPPDPPVDAHSARKHPCVLCQKRKVKCDRSYPCANCLKARVDCISPSTLPPRRRKKRFPEAELLARLRKYEAHLKRFGVDIDALNAEGASSPTSDQTQSAIPLPTGNSYGPDPRLFPSRSLSIRKSLKHVKHTMWSVSEEFKEAEEVLQGSSDDECFERPLTKTYDSINDNGGDIIFPAPSSENLRDLHPTPVQIFKLWQTFLDNVNPLIKIFHAPTIQQRILEASADLDNIPKGLEALMFGIYATAVMSTNVNEWDNSFEESKSTLLSRYQAGCRLALARAGLMRSSDMTILQAFTLYLLSCLNFSIDPRSLFCLSGIAVRIAQRMGLNFDGTSYGLPPFEVELRRRLWWQIMLLDFRVAELSGAGPTILTHTWTTKLPLNVNDSDLYPDMKEPPIEHPRISEMLFVLQRAEVGQILQQLRNSAFDIATKDKIIQELAQRLETKYLQHCDPSVPTHLLTTLMARTSISKLHMGPRHPHAAGTQIPSSDRDNLVRLSLEMIESHNAMMRSPGLKRFQWNVMTNFPFPGNVYLICALRHLVTGELADRAWKALEESAILRGDTGEGETDTNHRYRNSSIHVALANLTVKAWDSRLEANPTLVTPPFVQRLKILVLSKKSQKNTPTSANSSMPSNSTSNPETPTQYLSNTLNAIDNSISSQYPNNDPDHNQNHNSIPGMGGYAYGYGVGANFEPETMAMQGMTMEMGFDSMPGWSKTDSMNLSWDFWNDIMRLGTRGEEAGPPGMGQVEEGGDGNGNHNGDGGARFQF